MYNLWPFFYLSDFVMLFSENHSLSRDVARAFTLQAFNLGLIPLSSPSSTFNMLFIDALLGAQQWE